MATEVTPTGDVTITNAGVTAIGTSKVVNAMLATDAVTTVKITDANVTSAKLADDAVEEAKIKDAAVTNAKLDKANIPLSGFASASADVNLGSNKIINVTDPTAAQDAATKNYVDTVTAGITTLADGTIYIGNASNIATEVTLSGDVTTDNAGVTAIGTGKVNSLKILDGTIAVTDIANDAVETVKIKDANVITSKIANDAVTTAKIANNNVTYAKIQNVSASNRVLGRVSANAGIIEEIATTGSGDVVRATSPTLVTPALGTPSAVVLTNATGLLLTAGAGVTGILPETNGGTGSATKNFVDLTTAQTIAGVKTFSGSSTVVNQNLTVNAAGTTGQGIILSDDGDIVDNNDGAATFRFTSGVKINNDNKSLGTNTVIALDNDGNITASSLITGSQLISNVATGNPPLVVTSTTPVANLNIGGNAATATNIAGGAAGSIPYQSAAGTTTLLARGTNGQVLTLASGVPSWATPTGISALAAIGLTPNANGATISGSTLNLEPASASFGGVVTTGTQTFAGSKTFNSDLTVNGIRVGKGAANLGSNVAFGQSALNNSSASGFSNVAIGSSALTVLSSGGSNIAIGTNVLKSLTTGDRNLGIGADALSTSITGTDNTAIGHQSLMLATGTGNTALGSSAGAKITTGTSNVILGNSSSTNLTTGSNNVAIGVLAGSGTGVGGSTVNQTGTNSVFIGRSTQPQNDAQTNQVVISGFDGTNANSGLGSNTTLIGNSATTLTQLMGALNLPNTTTSTSTTTGALRVGGGVGIAGALNVGGNTVFTGTIEIDGGAPGAGKVLVSDANGLASWSANSNGGVSLISTTATMAATDNYNLIVFSGSTAGQTITLPSAVTVGAGREITIKNIASVSVSVASAAGNLISDSTTTGATSLSIGVEPSNNWIKAISTGANWIILRGLF